MSGGAEHDLLVRIVDVGDQVVVGGGDGVDVDEVLGKGNGASSFVHVPSVAPRPAPRTGRAGAWTFGARARSRGCGPAITLGDAGHDDVAWEETVGWFDSVEHNRWLSAQMRALLQEAQGAIVPTGFAHLTPRVVPTCRVESIWR